MYILASFWTFIAWEHAWKHFMKWEKRGKIGMAGFREKVTSEFPSIFLALNFCSLTDYQKL